MQRIDISRYNILLVLTLYLWSTLEKPTVGATHSRDSPTMDLAVQVLPALSSPTCSTVQYSTVQYSTVQCSTVQYSAVQYSAVQYSTGVEPHHQEVDLLVQARNLAPPPPRQAARAVTAHQIITDS